LGIFRSSLFTFLTGHHIHTFGGDRWQIVGDWHRANKTLCLMQKALKRVRIPSSALTGDEAKPFTKLVLFGTTNGENHGEIL
jgi:hypothetical protein